MVRVIPLNPVEKRELSLKEKISWDLTECISEENANLLIEVIVAMKEFVLVFIESRKFAEV